MMIEKDFTIKGTERFKEFIVFMESHYPEASFRRSPSCYSSTDHYDVSIRYNLSIAPLLEEFHSKWALEDDETAKKNKAFSFRQFFSQIFSTS